MNENERKSENRCHTPPGLKEVPGLLTSKADSVFRRSLGRSYLKNSVVATIRSDTDLEEHGDPASSSHCLDGGAAAFVDHLLLRGTGNE